MSNKTIKISYASLMQMFHPCDPDYIKNVCKARCCESSTGGIKVSVLDEEVAAVEALGATVVDNMLVAGANKKCPFKTGCNLCSIHEQKPFGCSASPFVLTTKDTLVVRNRYRMLKCYKDTGSVPAFIAHRWSLIKIFGAEEYDRIVHHMVHGVPGKNFEAILSEDNYNKIQGNKKIRKNDANE